MMNGVLVGVLQRNRTNSMCTYIYVEKDIHYKELSHAIMEAGRFQDHGVSRQVRSLGESIV